MFSKKALTVIQQISPELQDIYEMEMKSIKRGRVDDALLIESIAHNWSFNRFVKMARIRSKRWGFLSALTDKALEIQGITMLNLMRAIMAEAFLEASLERTLATYHRIKAKLNGHADDPQHTALINDAINDLLRIRKTTFNDLMDDFMRMRE